MGAVLLEFGTGAPCDAFGNANFGYRYILLHKKWIDLLLPDDEIAARMADWTPPEPRIKSGYIQRYVRLVQPTLKGAILRVD